MIYLDTSFLISWLIKDDLHHKKALDIVGEIQEDVFVTLDVLKEFLTVVTYKSSSEAALALFDIIYSGKFVQIVQETSEGFEETIETHRSLRYHKFSYVDCSLIAVARTMQCKVLTFDKELGKAVESLR